MAGLSNIRSNPRAILSFHNLTKSFTLSRPYSSSAAAQIEYEEEYDNDVDHQTELNRNRPIVDGDGSEPKRGVHWVVIGHPGSRKHFYAKSLSNLLDVPHISMGSLVRQQLNRHSFLYKQIEDTVNQGKLVPMNIVFSLLSKKLAEGYFKGESGFILDGIPRTVTQAEILDQMADIDLVLNFKCADENLVVDKSDCQLQGGQIKSFSDAGAWKEKLRTYSEQSKPLEDYYRKQNKLLDIQVDGQPVETWRGLLSTLQLRQVNSFRSALKLQHTSSFQKLTL